MPTKDALGSVRTVLTLIALGEGRPRDAVRVAKERRKQWPGIRGRDAGWSAALLITAHLHAGQPAEAARVVEAGLAAAASDREQMSFLSWTAFGYFWGGDLETSIELSRRGIAMEGGEEISWLWDDLAQPLIYLGRYDEAEQAARRTLELSPRKLWNGELALVELELLRGHPELAEQRLRTIVADGPVGLRWILTLALAEQGRYAEAETVARWTFARNPNEFNHGLLAWVLVAGDLDVGEGIKLAEAAMSIPRRFGDPPQLRALPYLPTKEHALGLGYLKQKRYDDAVRLLERAAELQPGRKLIEQHLAEARELS